MKKNKSWKKGLALLTAAALTAASLTGPGMVAYAEGRQAAEENLRDKEAAAEKVVISTREEFLKFAKNCRDDFYSYGKVFSLENDIDL